ncbi:MAG: acyl--CoA ligase [Aerococcus sp.]|nr:acyl--CoA ligase [Aerococcus sp.]
MRDTVPYDWLASRAYLSADDTAVIDLMTRTKISYRTLNQRASQLANYLIEEEGVAVGDRVAILALNVNQVIELYFACQKIGAIFVPLNWRLKQSELAYVMEDCEAKVLFYSEDLTQKLQGDWQHVVPTVIEITSEAYQNIFEYPELPETFSPAISGDQVAVMIYTSGTTGMPKGVMLSYAGIQQNGWCRHLRIRR